MISWKNATRIENRKFNSTYHHKPISKILPNTYLSSENSEFKYVDSFESDSYLN